VHRHGTSSQGKRRWKCVDCGHTYTWKNIGNKQLRQQVWFRRWVVEGYSLRQLTAQSGHSPKTLQRITHYWLEHPPVFSSNLSSCQYLILDGSFMERPKGLFVAMNAEDYSIVHGVVDVTEGPKDLSRFCHALAQRRARPKAAAIDGNPHLIKTLRRFWPQITIQRCLVHIQ